MERVYTTLLLDKLGIRPGMRVAAGCPRPPPALYHRRMELLVILIIALVLVVMLRGPKTLPKWGAALGRGVREAKTEASKAQAEIQARASEDTAPTDSSGDRPV